MKENISGFFNALGNQFFKRSITQTMPQARTLDKWDDFFYKTGISWLPYCAKGFYLNSRQVMIINNPVAFYDLILKKIEHANHRIVLASLYLGTGVLEKNLVSTLNQRLYEKNNLIVKILLDCIRGSRGEDNSRKMLLPILKNHSDSCQISLYQTPVLKQPFLSVLPERYKEIIGLQHIKVYLFDNDLIISGANLSNDYFTNRQDRYILIKECKELADFVDGFVDKVSEFSFQLDSNNQLHLHPTWKYHPVQSKVSTFVNEARSRLRDYYKGSVSERTEETDTVVFPLIEMGHFNINMDSTVTTRLIEESGDDIKAHLTTGYFNLTNSYADSIINKSKANFDILMAHPTANGFYEAKGPAKGIPFAYTELATQFLNKIDEAKQGSRVKMYEYVRPGWTYHAKGLWLTAAENGGPHLTMIGSPNFGERSVKRDLECQFLIATKSKDLQEELFKEKELLFSGGEKFTEAIAKKDDRESPLWVKAVNQDGPNLDLTKLFLLRKCQSLEEKALLTYRCEDIYEGHGDKTEGRVLEITS